MLSTVFLLLLGISATAYAKNCDGSCGQGEGDCDSDSDCLPGLVCYDDWWWKDDYCEAGPDTTNFRWSFWGEWSDCMGECGSVGTMSRHRDCVPPTNGGYECPAPFDSEIAECDTAPCPVDCEWDTWTVGECSATCGEGIRQNVRVKLLTEQFGGSCEGHANDIESCNNGECPPPTNPKCNPKTWASYSKTCCTDDANEPCGLGEGDCDTDDECAGDLVCGENNCLRMGSGFKKGSDCCELPTIKGSGNPNCNPANLPSWLVDGEEQNFVLKECCSEEKPCGYGQGDCDMDSECEGDLKCGNDNCGPSFFDSRTDCCE